MDKVKKKFSLKLCVGIGTNCTITWKYYASVLYFDIQTVNNFLQYYFIYEMTESNGLNSYIQYWWWTCSEWYVKIIFKFRFLPDSLIGFRKSRPKSSAANPNPDPHVSGPHGSGIVRGMDPDPPQNVMDLQRCLKGLNTDPCLKKD